MSWKLIYQLIMANILEEEANFSRVARIVLDLNSKVQREFLTTIVHPVAIPQHALHIKVFNKSQKGIVQNIANRGSYDECDSTLLYILIRNLCTNAPVGGWNKPVKPSSIGVADDIERLRVYRNDLYGHASTASLPNTDFTQFIQNMKTIMIRFDSCHGGTYQAGLSTGNYAKELNNIITSPMDPVLQDHYKNHFIQLMKFKTDLTLLARDLAMKATQIENLAYDVVSHETEIKKFGTDLINLDMKMSSQNDRIVDHNCKIKDLKNNAVTQNVKMNEVEKTLVCVDKKIEELDRDKRSSIHSIDSNIEILSSSIDTVASNLAVQKTDIETLSSNIEKVEMDVEVQLEDVKVQLEDIKGEIKTHMEVQLEDVKEDIKTQQDAITDMKKLILKHDVTENVFPSFPIDNNQKFDELIRDDGLSHSLQMKNSNWYLACHHDKIDQPEVLLNSFDRTKYAPGDQKVLKSYMCGNTTYEDENGYAKYLIEKFDQQFGEDLIQQPWLLTNLHEDCVENHNFYTLCRDVHSFCENKKYSFLLIDVSLEDNLRNLGFDVTKVKEQLKVYDAEDTENRIIVYIGENDIILNIRYVDSNNKKDISDAVRKSQDDTKLFCSLYQDLLQKSNISFVSMVVTNATNKNLLDIETCSKCISDNLIVSNSGLHTTLECIVKKREEQKISLSSTSTESTFTNLASRLWGTLSTRDIHLPHVRTDHDSALERIYLNGAQRQFLHSKKKHAMLCGGYGSGKSLLAQEKFKFLIQNAKKTDDIFYLCFNDDTLFKDVLKEQISESVNHQLRPEQVSILNVEEYGKRFGLLPPLMFSEIVEDIYERSMQTSTTPHIIADEYDSSNLTRLEADGIATNLKKVKDSYVLLIPQSLETVRKKVTRKWFWKRKKKYAGHEYERTGMEITTLHSIMRNTKSINELSKVTIWALEKCKSKINISKAPVLTEANTRNGHSDDIEHENNFTNEPNAPRTHCNNLDSNPSTNAMNSKVMRTSQENDSIDNCKMNKNDIGSKQTNQSNNLIKPDEEGRNQENTAWNEQLRADAKSIPVNFYHVLKNVNPSVESKSSSKAIESRFRFSGKGKDGHRVRGKLPVVIKAFKDIDINYNRINERDMKSRLVFALQNIINIREKFKGMAVIVFEPIEAQMFHAIFLSMEINTIVYTPAISTGLAQTNTVDMVDKLKDHILVTDHIGVRGLEFKNLLVTINPNETYLYQYLVEAFTRCLYELFFIVFNTGVKAKGKFSTENIIKLWEKKKLVQQCDIDVCKLHDENSESSQLYCKHVNHCYNIHLWHKDFRSTENVKNIKPCSQSDDKLRAQYNLLLSHAYLEEEVKRKQDEQVLSKECTRRGYKTYKDIILGNKKNIVEVLLKVKDRKYITNYRDVDGHSLLEIAFLNNCMASLRSMSLNRLQFPLPDWETCIDMIRSNNKGVVDILLKCKDNDKLIEYHDVDEHSLFEIAFLNNCITSLESMGRNGLQFPLPDWKTCIDMIRSNNKDVVDILLKCKDTDKFTEYYDVDGHSLFEIAFLNNCITSLESISLNGLQFPLPDWKTCIDMILSNNKDVVDILLKCKDNDKLTEYRDVDGHSLLDTAFLQRCTESIKAIIRFGLIDVSTITQKYDNTFMYNRIDYVSDLIRYDKRDELNILILNRKLIHRHGDNILNRDGRNILNNAAHYDKVYLFQLFIQYGCQVDVKDNKGKTTLHYAAQSGSDGVAKIILQNYPHIVDIKDINGWTALHLATRFNSDKVVDIILDKCPHIVDVRNNKGKTTLHYAVRKGSYDVAKIILQNYPHIIDIKDNNGWTALHYAAKYNSDKVVEIILEKCPHIVDVKNNKGKTTLHYAARSSSDVVAKIILQKYPHIIDIKDNNGWTALHHAAKYNSDKVVKIILEKCPHVVDVKDNYGRTALDYAKEVGSNKVVKVILEKSTYIVNVT